MFLNSSTVCKSLILSSTCRPNKSTLAASMRGLANLGWLITLLSIGVAEAGPAADRVEGKAGVAVTDGVAKQAVGDPKLRIYRIPGVTDNGGLANTGVATSVHCSNQSPESQEVQFRLQRFAGIAVSARLFTLTSGRTFTVSTHLTNLFFDDGVLAPGTRIDQGFISIAATSPLVFCSAMIVDAASSSPNGISLHMVRYNAEPGSQE